MSATPETLPAPENSATWEWDLEQRTALYSAAAVALVLGPDSKDSLDRAGWMNRVHPEDAPRVAAAIERAIAGTEERWQLTYRVRVADGSLRQIHDRGFIFRVDGRAVRALGVFEQGDGPSAPFSLASMLEGERLYRAVFDFIPQLCWIADASGWIDYYNQRWYEYTGTAPEQMEGWGWIVVHDPLDLPRLLRIWRNALATGQPWEDEFRLRRGSDGALRWHLSRALPLRNAEGRILRWFGTNTDVHDQKLAGEEYSRLLASEKHLRREAEAANRAKDEFLAVVSHELRTPLSVILNSAHLLRAGVPAEKQAAVLRRIETNAELQLKIVSDLLDVSRIIAGKLTIDRVPVDVSTLVQRAVEDALPAALAKGVALSQLATTSKTLVRGDATRIAQMVENLLGNAVKFTPPGKSVEVRVHDRPGHVDVEVRDEGAGISPEFLPRLFRRFSQADATSTRKHAGLGLGLSIVRELVELHGGMAFAHSDGPGLGATFTLRLPKLADPGAVPATPSERPIEEPSPPVPLTGLRVLVVDDEHDVRATVADMLLSCGAAVSTAGSVREALHVFRLGGIDVVVSDIAMPEQNGYELLARIRALPGPAGRTPVVALTAYASLPDREMAIAAGFDRYLAKPATVRQLAHAIAELCRNSLLGAEG